VRVYHFVDRKYGLDDIAKRRLKIARIGDLNDPFELLAASCETRQDREAWNSLKSDCDKRFGLLCFSRNWSNPLQWSHYADRHRGVCLGFEVPEHLLKPIAYAPRRLLWNRSSVLNDQEVGERFLEDVLSTKFSHWRYEQEMRLFVQLDSSTEQDGLYFYNFSSDLALSEVVVGSLSTVSRRELSDALGDVSDTTVCRKARLAFRSFKVVEQLKASLWQ
jgi:Protein of unknown function (DUF2971)